MSENPDALPQRLRHHLGRFAQAAGDGALVVRLPPPAGQWVTRGEGHFHLVPELFLQVAGTTRFRFPHAEQVLRPGEALIVPPRLLHDEEVRGGPSPGEAFANLVVCADGDALGCHLAHEAEPGRPGILHLETRHHPQSARMVQWLVDAATLGAGEEAPRHAAVQARALVAATVAGVLRALDDPAAGGARAESPLVARARVLIQNQLGDATLGVRGLAQQCGCSADYLSHVFARETGEHLAARIGRLRIERAAELLDSTDLAVKEIAWTCGFASPGYFIRVFRDLRQATPAAWRRARRVAGAAAAGEAGASAP